MNIISNPPDLATVANDINELHEALATKANEALKLAFECGKKLSDVKAQLSHGDWKVWVEENLDFSLRHAQRLMRLAKYEGKILANATSASHLTVDTALKLVSKPKDAQPAAILPAGLQAAFESDMAAIGASSRQRQILSAIVDICEVQSSPLEIAGKIDDTESTLAVTDSALAWLQDFRDALEERKTSEAKPHLEIVQTD
ncbi:MAG: DUF3102 domain-containing protein [Alphaproteobacteria bacterium]